MYKKFLYGSRQFVLGSLKKYIFCFIIIAGTISPVFAQNDSDGAKEISTVINNSKKLDASLKALSLVKSFYESRGHLPAWFFEGRLTRKGIDLLRILNESANEGLGFSLFHKKILEDYLKSSGKKVNPESMAKADVLMTDAFFALTSAYRFGLFPRVGSKVEWVKNANSFNYVQFLTDAQNGAVRTALNELLPNSRDYRTLKEAYLRVLKTYPKMEWPKVAGGAKLEPGMRDLRIREVRKRLQAEGYLKADNASTTYDDNLVIAVKKFQEVHALPPDGVIGGGTLEALNLTPEQKLARIRISLDRLRGFRPDTSRPYVFVNIPGFYLKVKDGESTRLGMNVIAGRPDRKTPLFSDEIEFVVFNPTWTVPKSIAVKDKLSKIQNNPDFLKNMGMKVYTTDNGNVTEVDPATIDWKNVNEDNFNYRIVQRPGTDNALGTIKFIFPNGEDVYLHDTNDHNLFKGGVRAFSSGCIRIEKPMEMAEWILRDVKGWDMKKIKAMSGGALTTVPLKHHVPIHLFYQTAWVDDDGILKFGNDIYKYDTVLAKSFGDSK
ncbi:L,D-transpeptidase family protein [bacterium]|nr:L,D-transpeptidase family protein [bacterium]